MLRFECPDPICSTAKIAGLELQIVTSATSEFTAIQIREQRRKCRLIPEIIPAMYSPWRSKDCRILMPLVRTTESTKRSGAPPLKP